MNQELTAEEQAALNNIVSKLSTFEKQRGNLIPILQMIQEKIAYLPPETLKMVAEHLGILECEVYGVATFYEQFHLEPHGRHTVRCCRGTACHVKGGPKIIEAIACALGVEPGETTEDMRFTFETVACLGTCFLAPVIMVNNDYYGYLSINQIEEILERYS